ncbi:hypothetical protein ACHAXR_007330 [Thalassiosira sp. AJA248-18]
MDVATCTATSTALLLQRQLAERHFQLEELEDCETSTTDVLLNTDRSVALGGTNGPLYTAGHGTWEENFKRFFQMKLMRTFITGADGSDPNEMGEFEYTVERTYNGECFMVGGSTIAMNGEILDVDEIFGERRVGFFNMIDTTEERERNLMDGENGQQVE